MALDLSSIQQGATNAHRPPIIVNHGVEGIGKTTLGAACPAPIILRTEDGLGKLQVDAFPQAQTFADVMSALEALAGGGHGYKTLVLDSLDWLEPLIWDATCKQHGWENIEQPGYGKGYVATLDQWREYLSAINYLRDQVGMAIFQTAHCEIRKFDDPTTDSYSRYEIKLHKNAAALVREHADAILFANYRIQTKAEDQGFNKKKVRAVGGGERVLYTQERPNFLAKNRFDMPDQLPMTFDSLAQHIPFFQNGSQTQSKSK